MIDIFHTLPGLSYRIAHQTVDLADQAFDIVHVRKLQQSIDEVGKASKEITNITEIIGNIADQTSLLSLNVASVVA